MRNLFRRFPKYISCITVCFSAMGIQCQTPRVLETQIAHLTDSGCSCCPCCCRKCRCHSGCRCPQIHGGGCCYCCCLLSQQRQKQLSRTWAPPCCCCCCYCTVLLDAIRVRQAECLQAGKRFYGATNEQQFFSVSRALSSLLVQFIQNQNGGRLWDFCVIRFCSPLVFNTMRRLMKKLIQFCCRCSSLSLSLSIALRCLFILRLVVES